MSKKVFYNYYWRLENIYSLLLYLSRTRLD